MAREATPLGGQTGAGLTTPSVPREREAVRLRPRSRARAQRGQAGGGGGVAVLSRASEEEAPMPASSRANEPVDVDAEAAAALATLEATASTSRTIARAMSTAGEGGASTRGKRSLFPLLLLPLVVLLGPSRLPARVPTPPLNWRFTPEDLVSATAASVVVCIVALNGGRDRQGATPSAGEEGSDCSTSSRAVEDTAPGGKDRLQSGQGS